MASIQRVIDITQYSNFESILGSSYLTESTEYEVIKGLVKLGHKHAQSAVQYNYELSRYIELCENAISAKVLNKPIIKISPNAIINSVSTEYNNKSRAELMEPCKECEAHKINYMRSAIPGVFAVWGGVFLLFAAISTTLFIIGIVTGIFFVPPWLNLILCIGFNGMLATVIVAIFERRSRLHAKKCKKGKKEC